MRSNYFFKGTLLVTGLLSLFNLDGQTYYSTFNTPNNGIEYTVSTSGLCIGCSVQNPEFAANSLMIDSTRLYMTVGVSNKVVLRLKLTDTSNGMAGFVVSNNIGLLNAGLLSGMVMRTYYNNSLVSSLSGSSFLSLSLLSGSSTQQVIEGAVNAKFNYVELELNNTLGSIWDLNVFYGFGTTLTPLPTKIFNIECNYISNGKLKLKWNAYSTSITIAFAIQNSTDGINYTTLDNFSLDNTNDVMQIERILELVTTGNQFIKISMMYENNQDACSEFIYFNGKQSISNNFVYPNPTTGAFKLNSTLDYDYISVINTSGAEVAKLYSCYSPDVSELTPGMYNLLFKLNDQIISTSIICKE